VTTYIKSENRKYILKTCLFGFDKYENECDSLYLNYQN